MVNKYPVGNLLLIRCKLTNPQRIKQSGEHTLQALFSLLLDCFTLLRISMVVTGTRKIRQVINNIGS